MLPRPLRCTLFPYTTLFRSAVVAGFLWLCWRIRKRNAGLWLVVLSWVVVYGAITGSFYVKFMRYMLPLYPFLTLMAASVLDRKSTRLNSSHTVISYAVFCLK